MGGRRGDVPGSSFNSKHVTRIYTTKSTVFPGCSRRCALNRLFKSTSRQRRMSVLTILVFCGDRRGTGGRRRDVHVWSRHPISFFPTPTPPGTCYEVLADNLLLTTVNQTGSGPNQPNISISCAAIGIGHGNFNNCPSPDRDADPKLCPEFYSLSSLSGRYGSAIFSRRHVAGQCGCRRLASLLASIYS